MGAPVIHFEIVGKDAKKLQDFVSASEYGAGPQDGFAVQFGGVTRSPAGRGGSFGKSRSIQVHFS